MTSTQLRRIVFTTIGLAVVWSAPETARTQESAGTTLDVTVPPGRNYDTAAFRVWYPKETGPVQGITVLVPGSGEDGRSMVDDSVWRAFAISHHLALVGCYITDKPHPQDFIEEYVNVSQGSGQAFLKALATLARRSKHPELAQAPLLLWGISAGGEFNYEFVAWKPERVVAFVVNKGGIYYTALVPQAAREVPGLLFIGEKDLEQRRNTIVGLFSVNRRAGALWALTEEPGIAHDIGRSVTLSTIFFEDVLALRRNSAAHTPTRRPSGTLDAVTEQSGFLGDLKQKTFQAVGAAPLRGDHPLTAWLPTERVARAWRAVVTGAPFDPGEH